MPWASPKTTSASSATPAIADTTPNRIARPSRSMSPSPISASPAAATLWPKGSGTAMASATSAVKAPRMRSDFGPVTTTTRGRNRFSARDNTCATLSGDGAEDRCVDGAPRQPAGQDQPVTPEHQLDAEQHDGEAPQRGETRKGRHRQRGRQREDGDQHAEAAIAQRIDDIGHADARRGQLLRRNGQGWRRSAWAPRRCRPPCPRITAPPRRALRARGDAADK